jgi:enoyl-CoA hydratase
MAAAANYHAFSRSAFSTLVVDDREESLHVQLNRPDTKNAISQTMVDELHVVCSHLELRPKILVLHGTPADADKGTKAVFASGADIRQLRDRRRDDALAGINSGLFDRIGKLSAPVIAALDGYALGGGAELAYAADFRIGTPALRMGNPEPGLGIIAAAGATWRLKELVGEPMAKEILIGGRVLTGEECLKIGLITRLVEPTDLMEAVHTLVSAVAAQDALAVRLTKLTFHAPREAHPVIDTLAQGILFESQAKFDRMLAFTQRRKPERTNS